MPGKADQAKANAAMQQTEKMQSMIAKMQTKLQDPDLTPEEVEEITQAIDDFQAKIDRLSVKSQP